MAGIEFDRTTKHYPDGTAAVRELSLEIPDGTFMVLVGPSGCGKTTALRMIAGLEEVSGGEIRIGDRRINDVPARDRDIAMVFQDYALYPHMTVFENMAFSLRLRRAKREEIRAQVEGAAETLGLGEMLDKRPRALSGGQRQRVAMGRALVRSPSAFLMDEPLSNLDAKLRVQMRVEIRRLQRQVGTTTVYVTHDQVEAMTLGDQVAVMKDGQLQQVAPPEELYRNPCNSFVAGFMGSPAMNFAQADVSVDGEALSLRVGEQSLTLAPGFVAGRPELTSYVGRRVLLGIRPEGFGIDRDGVDGQAPGGCSLAVRVELREALGADDLLHFRIGRNGSVAATPVDGGDSWVAAVPGRSGAREGDLVPLRVDLDELRFFDCDSGEAIARGADR